MTRFELVSTMVAQIVAGYLAGSDNATHGGFDSRGQLVRHAVSAAIEILSQVSDLEQESGE